MKSSKSATNAILDDDIVNDMSPTEQIKNINKCYYRYVNIKSIRQ